MQPRKSSALSSEPDDAEPLARRDFAICLKYLGRTGGAQRRCVCVCVWVLNFVRLNACYLFFVVSLHLRLVLVSRPLFKGLCLVLDCEVFFLCLVLVLDWTHSLVSNAFSTTVSEMGVFRNRHSC